MTNLDPGTDRRATMGRGVRMAATGTQTVGYVLAGWWLGGQLQPVWGEKVGAMLGVNCEVIRENQYTVASRTRKEQHTEISNT